MRGVGGPFGRIAEAASGSAEVRRRGYRSHVQVAVLIAVLVVLLAIVGAVAAEQGVVEPKGGTAPIVLSLSPGGSSSLNNSSLNNTFSGLGNATVAFVGWFLHGLETVFELVFGTLLLGGILNYILVGRKRGEWTPLEAEGLRNRGQPAGPAEASGRPPPSGSS